MSNMISHLLPWCRGQGRKAQNKPKEKQAEMAENVKEKLEVSQIQENKRWNLRGSFVTKLRDEYIEKKMAISEGLSSVIHKKRLHEGVFFLLFVLLILLGEFFLLRWTLEPFQVKFEAILIAASVTLIGMLCVDRGLAYIKKVKPEAYKKVILTMVLISLILLVLAGLLLAHTRGVLLQSEISDQGPEERIEKADKFYRKTSYLPMVMGMISVGMSFITGVILHEALSRVITSVNVLSLERKIKRTNEKILYARLRLEEAETFVKAGMNEFRIGLLEEPLKKRKSLPLPVTILLLTIMLILILFAIARGEEKESVYAIIDISKSSLCKDYSGKNEFQKNISAIPEIVKQIQPGTEFRIIAITERSFERPFVIIKETLPLEEGAFGEKLAKAKLSIMQKWDKLDLKPASKGTDIFGVLHYIAVLCSNDYGKKTIIFLSDMRNTVGFDLEKPAYIDVMVIKEVEEDGLIPRLDGVDVWVLGASSCGKSIKYFQSLRRFWEKYFHIAGARLVSFSPEREWEANFKGDRND